MKKNIVFAKNNTASSILQTWNNEALCENWVEDRTKYRKLKWQIIKLFNPKQY